MRQRPAFAAQEIARQPARPGTRGARVTDDAVAIPADGAEDVRLQFYCHSPRRPETIFCNPVALAPSPCTGAVTTISMRDQNRDGSLLMGALPSRRLKKLPHSPRNAMGTTGT